MATESGLHGLASLLVSFGNNLPNADNPVKIAATRKLGDLNVSSL